LLKIAGFYLLIICFWFNQNGYAQLPTNLQFTNYTRANGLPEEHVTSTVEDSRGFLWVGTQEGLFRFDGKNYKSWYAQANDSTKFKSNSITVVDEYIPGKILFVSYRNLWSIDISNHKIEPVPSFAKNEIAIPPLKVNKDLWVVSCWDSIYFVNANFQKKFALKVGDYFNEFDAVIPFALQSPFIILRSNLANNFYFFNYATKQMLPFTIDDKEFDPRSRAISALANDSTIKRLYVSNYFAGIGFIDLDIGKKTNYSVTMFPNLKNGTVLNAKLVNKSMLLLATGQGLDITEFKEYKNYNSKTVMDKPMLAASVTNISAVRDNKYWLSTKNGLSSFTLKSNRIQYWQKEIPLSYPDETKGIIKANDGNIYVLYASQGLFKINPITNVSTKVKGFSTGNWWRMDVDNNKIICVGGYDKVVLYDVTTQQLTKPNYLNKFYTPANDLVTIVHKAKNGDIWYSANVGVGLIRYNASNGEYKQYSILQSPPAIKIRYATSVTEDCKGNIWFSTNKAHILVRWDAALQKLSETTTADFLPNYKVFSGVTCLHSDNEDNLWISLEGSAVLKYNPFTKKGDYYDLNKGLPTVYVNNIISDSKNRVWMATTKGLACYIPVNNKIVNFTTNDGLPEDNFESLALYFEIKENKLYVGGKKSVAFFNPDSLLQNVNSVKPPVFIEDVIVNGKPLYFANGETAILQPDENNISFNFAVPDFERNNQLEFEYKISGSKKQWVSLGDKRSVTLNDLVPGKYIVSVRCRHKGTENWTETQYPFSFKIKTPWYKSWWFILLVLLSSIGLIWFVVRQYYLRKLEHQKAIVQQQKAIEQERSRIAADMHDDLGSGLTRINYATQIAMAKQPSKDDLMHIKNISTGLVENMREIIWAMKDENNNAEELLFYIKNYAVTYCTEHGLQIEVNMPEINDIITVNGQHRRNIYLAIKETLHNIVKHAEATKVTINASCNKDWIIEIRDNGKGNVDIENKKGNGLQNIRKRIETVGGKAVFENLQNGFAVRMIVPI
jgi:ligand-binding sensor domain-containing protein/two-component sensor histidine kinase